MGVIMGLIGDRIKHVRHAPPEKISCPHCELGPEHIHKHERKTTAQRARSVFKYAFIELPKEIGLELLIGIVLATVVATFAPLGQLIKSCLGGWIGYPFAIVFGIFTYICSTATVPFVDSLIKQGMSMGAGMTLLLIGPVTSYGTLFVLKKEYGSKVLTVFLVSLIVISLILGLGFQLVSS